MADNIRTTPLRLRPSEHRMILFIGDLIMSITSMFAALETWNRYNLYKYNNVLENYIAQGFSADRARVLAERIIDISVDVPFWFYVLSIIWVVLLVELYEPHVAGSGRRTTLCVMTFARAAAGSVRFSPYFSSE